MTWDGSAETNGSFNITGSSQADTITGGAGADTYYRVVRIRHDTHLSSSDTIDGGAGTDELRFTDSGSATSDLDRVTNVETVTLGDAATSVTTVDALVGSGETLTVNAAALTATNALTWDGSAETNGSFNITGSSQADTITGGAGADTVTAGSGNDTLRFVSGADLANDVIVDGGAGTDTITFTQNGIVDVDDTDFVNVASIEAIAFGSGNNVSGLSINVAAASATLPLRISSGAGSDAFDLGGLDKITVISTGASADTNRSRYALLGYD